MLRVSIKTKYNVYYSKYSNRNNRFGRNRFGSRRAVARPWQAIHENSSNQKLFYKYELTNLLFLGRK